MSTIIGREAYVTVSGTTIVASMAGWTINDSTPAITVETLVGDTIIVRGKGKRSITGEVSGFFNPADVTGQTILYDNYVAGTAVPGFRLYLDTYSYYYNTGGVYIEDYNTSAAVDNIIKLDFTFIASGDWVLSTGAAPVQGDLVTAAIINASSDNRVARYDGTNDIQGSLVTIDDSGNISTGGTISGSYIYGDGSYLTGISGGGGTSDHSALNELAYDDAGHTGFTKKVDYIDGPLSPQVLTGGMTTSGTNTGTFKVSALTAILRTTDSETGPLALVSLAEQDSVAMASADVSYYITLSYNGGSPTITGTITNPYNADKRNIPIGRVMKNSSNEVHWVSGGYHFQDGVKKLHMLAKSLKSLRLTSGCAIAYSGTNNFTMEAGTIFGGLNKFSISAYDSATTKFTPIYRDGAAGFTEGADSNTIDYTHYDDGDGTLGTIGNNKYGCFWVYIHADDTDVYVRYGEDSYSLAEAEVAPEPTKPEHLTTFGLLIGRIIAPQAGGSFTEVQMVTDSVFTGTGVSDHGALSGLTDDDHILYSLADGTRAFTGTVGGIAPTSDLHLSTKKYVDDNIILDHGNLSGLLDDDHTQYILHVYGTGAANLVGGINAGSSLQAGSAYNLLLGNSAGRDITTSMNNICVGNQSGDHITTGESNISIGYAAGASSNPGQGDHNICIGMQAGHYLSSGQNNILIGHQAGQYLSATANHNNVIIGHQAGQHTGLGTGNTFIGYQAGHDETGSNKLYISNSNSTSPLIYGDFSVRALEINGTLQIRYGTTINEFSTDGTLAGNSDEAVPTEKAVKTYVDDAITTFDKISEGDSSVEVIDTGTGQIDLDVDGTRRAMLNASGLQLGETGPRIASFVDEDTMASDSATKVPTQQSVKAYVTTTSGDIIDYVDAEIADIAFTELTDTPSNYSSAESNRDVEALKLLAVNSDSNAVEFATAVSSILDGGASDVEYTGTVLFGIWIPHNPLDGGVSNNDYDGLAAMDGGSASSF